MALEKCPRCGAKVQPTDTVCLECGLDLIEARKKIVQLEERWLPLQDHLAKTFAPEISNKYPIDTDVGAMGPAGFSRIRLAEAEAAPSPEPAPDAVSKESVATAVKEPTEKKGTDAASEERNKLFDRLVADLKEMTVDEQFLLDLLEVYECGADLASLFEEESEPLNIQVATEKVKEASRRPEQKKEDVPESIRLIPIYKLSSDYQLFFGDRGLPVSVPVQRMFVPFVDDPDAFGFELGDDSMSCNGKPSFDLNDIVIVENHPPENRGFAVVRTKEDVAMRQVFFDDDRMVRLCPLNREHREQVLYRWEIRSMWRVVGHYKRIDANE